MFPYWPRTVENRAAIRTSVSTLIAVLIAFQFHVPNPFWAGMSVVIVTNLYSGSIIDKAIMRITGTVVGAVLGFYIVGLIANSFFLYLLSCFLLIAVSVYYYYYSKQGYAYLLGALCAFIIISQIVINPADAFEVAIWRPVEIAIGVIVSALGVYGIFPNHLKDNIQVQLDDLFDNFRTEFKEIALCIERLEPNMTPIRDRNLKIKKKIRKATELIGALNREWGVEQHKVDELRAFLDSFFTIARQIQYLISVPYELSEISFLQSIPVQPVFFAIEEDLQQLQVRITQKSFSIKLKTHSVLEELEKKIQETAINPAIKNDFIFSLLVFFHQINDLLVFLQSLLVKNPIQKDSKDIILTKKDRMKSDFTVIKHSIKAGLSVLIALGFWLVSNWPGGINGIISSLIISLKLNFLEMRTTIFHRLLGCSIGGGIALSSLAITEMNLYDFIVIMLLFVWGFTYFMFKQPKYAYIGLQANIAFIITLAQEGGPPTVLDPPLQRLAGVVIGIVASFIVANVLWRSDVWTVLNRYRTKLFKYMTVNLEQILFVKGQKTIHDVSNLFWVTRGLIEALADEQLSEKKRQRLSKLRDEFEAFVMMQATISYIFVSIHREKAITTASLFDLDLSAIEGRIVTAYKAPHPAEPHKLVEDILQLMEEIKNNPHYSSVDLNSLRNFLAYLNALKQLSLTLCSSNQYEHINLGLQKQLT